MTAHADKQEYIKENGMYVSTPSGKSMLPFIVEGRDNVVVLPVQRPLKKFDIILYITPSGTHVMHRIIRICAQGYIVRGDNCFYKEHVSKESVIGVADSIITHGRHKDLKSFRCRFPAAVWYYIYPFRFLLKTGRKAIRKIFKK